MKEATRKMIRLALESDDTVDDAGRTAILAFCRDPAPPAPPGVVRPVERWVPCREAADRLSVSLRTVQRLVKSGALPSRRLLRCVRIPASALLRPPSRHEEEAAIWHSPDPTDPGDSERSNSMRAK